MDKTVLNYVEPFKTGSYPKSTFKLSRKPVFVEHKVKQAVWFGCVIWDEEARKEFKIHEDMENALQTTMFFGRMLRNCIKDPLEGMAEQMNWKKPFILVDVIGDKFGSCGINKFLRVRETPTWNTDGGGGFHELKLWDLVIFPECLELADEMIRREYFGVKKTLCIWNADLSPYPKHWVDDGDHVSGEIFLRPTKKMNEKILTVIIFHHGQLENFKEVPAQSLMAPKEDKVVKLYSESFHHYELVVAKLYPKSLPQDQLDNKKGEESKNNCSSFTVEERDSVIEKSNDEGLVPVPIPVLREIVKRLTVNNLEPLKEKLKKLRKEKMSTKLDQHEEIEIGYREAKRSKFLEKDIRTGEDMRLSSGSTSVVTTDDEDKIAGSLCHGRDAVFVIDETDYDQSDVESETMSIDVVKQADQEIRKLAEYFLEARNRK